MCLHLLSGLWRCISVIVMQSCNWLCIKAWRRIIGILLIRGNKEGNAVAVRMHFVWKSPQLHCKWFGCLDYSLFNPSWVFIPWRMSLTKVNVHYNAREGDPRRSCFLRNLLYYYIYLHLIHYCIFAAVSFPTAALTKTLLPLSSIWILFLWINWVNEGLPLLASTSRTVTSHVGQGLLSANWFFECLYK